MGTYVVLGVIALGLVLVVRHLWNNFKSGKSDCCGTDGSCCSCHGCDVKE